MKAILEKLALPIILLLLISGCTKEAFDPIDIFEEEELPPVDVNGMIDTENFTQIAAPTLCGGVQLWANKERTKELPGGIEIKGTLFAETSEGITSISSGDFSIDFDAPDELDRFKGFGGFQLPSVGIFDEHFEMSDLFGADLQYASGAAFIGLDEELPLKEDDCYIRLSFEESAGLIPGVDGAPLKIGQSLMQFGAMYVQPNTPAILVKGSLDQYAKTDNLKKVADGTGKKKFPGLPKKKFALDDVYIGISARPHFRFNPNTFSDELEGIVGGTGFEEFDGSLYLKGTLSIPKYPLRLEGESVLQSAASVSGVIDIFENGLPDAFYTQGINGKLFFGNDLLDLLPFETEVELGRATAQLSVGLDETYLKFAGEYDTDILGILIGDDLAEWFPRPTQSGKLYASIGTDLSDWEYYFEHKMGFNIPGFGPQETSSTIIHLTPQGFFLNMKTNLPYGIGMTELTGEIKSDGTFSLKGVADANLQIGDVALGAAGLNVEISNQGFFINGMLQIGGGISDFRFNGEISADRIALSGQQTVNIDFGGGARLATDLTLDASTDYGVKLSGMMETPFDVAKIAVIGEVTTRGLGLAGSINAILDFGVTKLQGDIEISASTWAGAKVHGFVDVPLAIIGATVEVNGMITGPTQFSLEAYSSVFIDLFVTSGEAALCWRFNQNEIKIGAEATLCVGVDPLQVCPTVGLRINPNWGAGTVSICVTLPIVDEVCI